MPVSSNKRYLWIAHESNYSGANRAAEEFTEVLRNKGHSVIWVVPAAGEFSQVLSKKKYDFREIGFYNWTVPLNRRIRSGGQFRKTTRNIKSTWDIYQLIKGVAIDIIVSNTISFYVGALATWFSRANHIWLIHEFGEEDHGIVPWIGNKGYSWLGNFSHKVVVNSIAVKKKFVQFVPQRKIIVQSNYILIDAVPKVPTAISDGILSLLILGQITSGKGHSDAIYAIIALGDRAKRIRLDIIGSVVDKQYYKELSDLVDANYLNEIVIFHDHIDNPLEVIKNHNLLLMCSKNEAYGRVTEEAMRLGVPVIGRNSGNTKYMVQDGINGFLYETIENLELLLGRLIDGEIDLIPLGATTTSDSMSRFKNDSTSVLTAFEMDHHA